MSDPLDNLSELETTHLFLCFCSFCTLNVNKKLNMANTFLLILKEPKYREFLKKYCDFNSDYAAFKFFLKYDNTLYKSKYIIKFLNSKAFEILK